LHLFLKHTKMEANKILSADVLDILFEKRNKDYGAYQLRKTYAKRITKALLITGSVAMLALLCSFMANKLNANTVKAKKTEMNLIELTPEEEKKIEPPPLPPPVKPIVEMKQFTPPVIKKDEEVKQEEKPPEPHPAAPVDPGPVRTATRRAAPAHRGPAGGAGGGGAAGRR